MQIARSVDTVERERERERELYFRELGVANFLCCKLESNNRYKDKVKNM